MITLSTGLPGAGKTLYTIAYVKELSEREARPVYYSGIKDLALPWFEIDPEKWFECPDGSIIVIDECQRLFRPRGNGSQVPPYVSRLETHRHAGIDIFLVTQHPMLVDANVRRLTERHFHISRRFGLQRATVLEFQSCKDQPLAKTADAQRHLWSYPPKVFEYYKSAEVHTVKRRLPMQLWVLIAVLALVAGAIWYFIHSHYQDGKVILPGSVKPETPVIDASKAAPKPAEKPHPRTVAEYLDHYKPRVAGLAYTAPVYDDVTKPTIAPVPVGAVKFKGSCRAYSQQGTPLDMSPELCLSILEKGFFREWQDAAPRETAKKATAETAQPAVIATR